MVGLTAAFFTLRDEIRFSNDSIATLGDYVRVLTDEIGDFLSSWWAFVKAFTVDWWTKTSKGFSFLGDMAKLGMSGVIAAFVSARLIITENWKQFPAAFGDIILEAVNRGSTYFTLFQRETIKMFNKILPDSLQINVQEAKFSDDISNHFKGEADKLLGKMDEINTKAQQTDWLGDAKENAKSELQRYGDSYCKCDR